MNRALVLGANGATGKLLVKSLLQKGVEVVAVVRQPNALQSLYYRYPELSIVQASISEMNEIVLAHYLKSCDAVYSCLGHNLTLKGIFGQPRRLVKDTIEKVVDAIELINPSEPIKIILMNTTGNANRDIPEVPPLSQRIVVSMVRALLPPHVDNEQAAEFLRVEVGQHHHQAEWVVVRPDGLIDESNLSHYQIVESPTRNVIFDAGKTSRINVADFMSSLATEKTLWQQWKGKMPVIYNQG